MTHSTIYSQYARRVLRQAHEFALTYHHEMIDTGHLLVGILREPASLGAQMLQQAAIDRRRAELELRLLHDVIDPLQPAPDWTAALRQVIGRARWEADRRQHEAVGTEHLVLALVSLEQGSMVALCEAQGVRLRPLRQHMIQFVDACTPEVVLEKTRRAASLSEMSRRVLHAAGQLAAARGVPTPAPEHLLAAIVREQRSPMSDILRQQHLDVLGLAEMLKQESGEQADMRSEFLEDIIDQAVDHALRQGAHYTGTDHLLLALTYHRYGVGLLRRFGVDPAALSAAIHQSFALRGIGE